MPLRFFRRRTDALSRAERAIDDELAAHFAHAVADLQRRGLSPEAARAEAEHRFGDRHDYRARLVLDAHGDARRHARRAIMQIFSMSGRALWRGIRRSPGFALGVIGIMTLGLGANAVTFTLVDRLALSGFRTLDAPERLGRIAVHVRNDAGVERLRTDLAYQDYRTMLEATQLDGVAAETAASMLFGKGDAAERIRGVLVTANYFRLLGVSPAAGRFFTADESERQGLRLAVLSHDFWQRRFNGAAEAIGQTVDIGGSRYDVIGVAPHGFTGTTVGTVDVFLPLEAASDEVIDGIWRTGYNIGWLQAVVRLAPGATRASAAAEMTPLYVRARSAGRAEPIVARVTIDPLGGSAVDGTADQRRIALLLWGVALVVLLIAAANVANLFLARTIRQSDQIAVRLALGASRARIVAEQAIEGALLALAGAAAATFAALLITPIVQRRLFPQIDWLGTAIDVRGLLFVAACAVVGGALAASLPLWRTGGVELSRALRSGTRTSRARGRAQTLMLTLQGALSVVLLVGAALFVQSLGRAQSIDLGLDVNRVLVLTATPGDTPVAPGFRDEWRARVDRIPGVEQTTLVAGTFPFVSSWAVGVTIPGLPEQPRVEGGGPYVAWVEAGYFDAVGTRIADGRAFTEDDRAGAPLVTIVNETLARLYWPGRSAIGQCMQIGRDAPCSTVVGIAMNTRRQGVVEGDELLFYVPIQQAEARVQRNARILVRSTESRDATLARVSEQARREALAIAPGLRFVTARRMDELVAPQLRDWRVGASLFGVFGLLALAVAAVGFYSVIAFDVEGRRHEMGLRSALGAPSQSIVRLIVIDGVRLAAGGVALGAIAAWFLAPMASDLLYGVDPHDAPALGGAAAVLLVAAILASVLPALRASRIDPSLVLRQG